MKAELLVLKGKNSGLLIQVGQELTVGRDADCDLQLFDEGISRVHLRVYHQGRDFFVADLGSAQGTFLHDARLAAPHAVFHQDLIHCGEATLQFFCPRALHPGRSAVDLWSEPMEGEAPLSLEDYAVEDRGGSEGHSGEFHLEMIYLCRLLEDIARQEKAQQVIETLIGSVGRLIPYRRIVFIRYDASDDRLIPTKHRRAPEDAPGGWWKVNRVLIERCCQSGEMIGQAAPDGAFAALVAPFKGRRGIVGALYMEVDRGRNVSRQQELLGAVCGQAGLALERCQLLSRVRHQNMQLRESNAARQVEELKLRTLLGSLNEGVALLDQRGEVLVASPLGYRHLSTLGLQGEDGRISQLCGRPLSEFGAEQVELDGQTYVIYVAHTAAEDWQGYGLVIREISEELQARDRLLQAEKLSSLGQTVAGVAHELNNPLTGVLGFSEMLLTAEGLSERSARQVELIHREAHRCRRIVKNLLTFARQTGPELGPVRIGPLLTQVMELKAYELKMDDVAVVFESAEDVPVTYADAHQLKQLFLNLLHNAYQAISDEGGAEGGTVTLRAYVEEGTIIVQVCDTGPGITDADLPRIFDPFFTTKQVGQGTGLGLSLSYGIVQEHGGELSAQNTPGSGACFTVRLPVRAVPREVACSDIPAVRPGSGAPGRTISVLVVDDEQVVRELIGATLSELGCGFVFARSGREALRLATENEYDCMICDLKMPGMGGQDLYDALRRRSNSIADRTVFMSGDVVNEHSHGFLVESGCPYVLKPFSLTQIEQALRNLPGVAL